MTHSSTRKRDQQHELNVGNRFHQRGDWSKSAAAYARYLERYPFDKAGHFNLAVTLQDGGDHAAAMHSYCKALEIDPWYAEALNNLGILFHRQGQLEKAKLCYARALASRPHYDDAEYNFAAAESECGNPANAIFHLSRLLKRNPKRADAWNNLGNALLALNSPADALAAFRLAASLKPDLPDVAWNAASAELLLGHLPQGWQGFESRHPSVPASIPRWDGSKINGKSLLLLAEQGYGDTLQFLRYCGQVKTVSCAEIVLACHPELLPLVSGIPGVDRFVPLDENMPAADYQIPLLSLPLIFGTSLETIPADTPYIPAQKLLIEQWGHQIAFPKNRLKVGLVWSGNPAHRNDRNRSMDSVLLETLGECENVAFYCLQQKPQSAAAANLRSFTFEQMLDELTFADTAAILFHLDLVITVDTAIAHLAGALGRNVWTLLPYAPDWRWMLQRSDSPWYPTMRLFRQPRPNAWAAVLKQVKSEIAALQASYQIV